jgi:hypothetical protein
MLATLEAKIAADVAAAKAWVVKAWTYVQSEYKQLAVAVAVGHYTGVVESVVTWLKAHVI